MKNKMFPLRAAAEAATGGNAPEGKVKTVKVRAGSQAVHVDGIHIAAGKEGEIPVKRLESLGTLVSKVGCVLLGLLLLGSQVQAQLYAPANNYVAQTNGSALRLNGGTNNIALATTNTYNSVINLTKWGEVAIQPVFKLTAGGTTNVTFKFSQSVDGTNFVADATRTINVAASGTTTVTAIGTNQTVGPVGYLRLDTIENPNGVGAVTNLQLFAVPKPLRFGS